MMVSSLNEKKYWIALAHCEALSPLHWKKLLEYFQSAEAIWHASQQALEHTGIPQHVAAELIATRGIVDPDRAMERMEKENIAAVTINNPLYPTLLKEITDPPFVLFVQGELRAKEPVGALGVVGTRKISPYGQSVLPPIIRECVNAGVTIVSGLALGIDGLAHETTLAHDGRTIAVIGSGIDRTNIYPRQHRQLADRIVATGSAIVSEYPPGTPPTTYHFPARNRIISGLSLGVLVCEAPEKSGALITAFAAVDQNRDVFAIPGPIQHPNSWGPHDLLKRGAIPVTNASDILQALPIAPHRKPQSIAQNKEKKETAVTNDIEEKIIAVLTEGVIPIDELIRRSDLTAEVATSTLVLMEMQGKVRNVGNMHYTLN